MDHQAHIEQENQTRTFGAARLGQHNVYAINGGLPLRTTRKSSLPRMVYHRPKRNENSLRRCERYNKARFNTYNEAADA